MNQSAPGLYSLPHAVFLRRLAGATRGTSLDARLGRAAFVALRLIDLLGPDERPPSPDAFHYQHAATERACRGLPADRPETSHLITWKIRELGFDMHLSGQVPTEISRAMKEVGDQITRGENPLSMDLWAIHPGGRTVLDAVEKGLGLRADALCHSRDILARFGNMSSATVMFVLENVMRTAHSGQRGCAMSFGPGVTAETMLFHAA